MPTEMSIGISRLLDSYSEHPAEARVEEALTAKRMRSVTASDTLFEIAARVDDETLLALYPAHREQISWLISDNNWWYIRTQHLVGQRLINRQANWSRIYYALDHEVLGSDFDYLPLCWCTRSCMDLTMKTGVKRLRELYGSLWLTRMYWSTSSLRVSYTRSRSQELRMQSRRDG